MAVLRVTEYPNFDALLDGEGSANVKPTATPTSSSPTSAPDHPADEYLTADQTTDLVAGSPTSSSTTPVTVVDMIEHLDLGEGTACWRSAQVPATPPR
ncbi:hypothetical protein GCM10010346_53200 [Streptomyces chryseus]|uniref:Uncharacterized protein n=1 Tax=Streptomyces chryseus TaxID=68186 RepID=A0ABQ3E1T3_9ACTN|nr:hypothetical protein GCM10010346_53200 [Streptomyces chryseus]